MRFSCISGFLLLHQVAGQESTKCDAISKQEHCEDHSDCRWNGATCVNACFLHRTAWVQQDGSHNMPGQDRAEMSAAKGCMDRCFNTQGCAHFTFWDKDGGCHLTDKDAKRKESSGSLSGERACTAVCYDIGVKFDPGMEGQGRSEEHTAAKCQQRCRKVDGCKHFSWWLDKGCHLQDGNAKPKNDKMATSGPAHCTAPPMPSTLPPTVNPPSSDEYIQMGAGMVIRLENTATSKYLYNGKAGGAVFASDQEDEGSQWQVEAVADSKHRFFLKNKHSGLYLHINGGKTDVGNQVFESNSKSQGSHFKFESVGGSHMKVRLLSVRSGLYIGDSLAMGGFVGQMTKADGVAWHVTLVGTLSTPPPTKLPLPGGGGSMPSSVSAALEKGKKGAMNAMLAERHSQSVPVEAPQGSFGPVMIGAGACTIVGLLSTLVSTNWKLQSARREHSGMEEGLVTSDSDMEMTPLIAHPQGTPRFLQLFEPAE